MQLDPNAKLLDQIKRKREEHSTLTQAEQLNLQLAREAHKSAVINDERRTKAAWAEVAAARTQVEITKSEQDNRARDLATWQRKNEFKETELKDLEDALKSQSTDLQSNIKKLQKAMVERTEKIREDLNRLLELLEQCEIQVRNFQLLE